MTLLELLVKEMSWPVEAHGAVQDRSGQIWFCKSGKPYYTGVIWGADPISLDFNWVYCGPVLARSDDYATAIVTREQYEAAIAAQQQVWNGEGLPPVGVECEASVDGGESWALWYTMAEDSGVVIFGYLDGDHKAFGKKDMPLFRPIRTEAERKREESIEAIRLATASSDQDKPYNEAIYDAIAAGKIPGVELSK